MNSIPFPWIFPDTVQVEPTNHCNLDCTMCPRRNMTYPKGFMDLAVFKKIVDEMAEKRPVIRILQIKLFFLGEPLLHPELQEMLEYANANDIRIGVVTNGLLLNKSNSVWLLKNAWQIGVSVDGVDAATYEQLRVHSNYAKVVENVKRLCSLKQSLGSSAGLRLITMVPDDDVEAGKWVTAILYQWREYDILVGLLHRQSHPNTTWLGKTSVVSKPQRTEPCVDGLSSLVVRWDGETTFCCGDINTQNSLGNVKEKTLQGMWVSNELWAIRRNMFALNYEAIASCRKCTVVKQWQRRIVLPFELRDKLEM